MSVPAIREVKQLSNVFVVFCILQVVCIVLTARVSIDDIVSVVGDHFEICGHPKYST